MTLRLTWCKAALAGVVAVGILACGGSKQSVAGSGNNEVGQSGADGTDDGAIEGVPAGDAGPVTDAAVDAGPPAAVTFVIHNTAKTELAFSVTKGWQPNIFAFTGKPPKAQSYLLYPTHCTATCDTAEEERCPLCEEPETAKEELALQKFERVAAGGTLEVPWDGQVIAYEKTRGTRNGKTKRCQCYRQTPAEPGTYTVRVCGLRLTKEVGTDTRPQCTDAQLTWPSETPVRLEFNFAALPKK